MNANEDYLPQLPDIRQTRGGVMDLLQARGAALEAAERIEAVTIGAGLTMAPTEQREFDKHISEIKRLSELLAEYRREREADNDSGLPVIFPF